MVYFVLDTADVDGDPAIERFTPHDHERFGREGSHRTGKSVALQRLNTGVGTC